MGVVHYTYDRCERTTDKGECSNVATVLYRTTPMCSHCATQQTFRDIESNFASPFPVMA